MTPEPLPVIAVAVLAAALSFAGVAGVLAFARRQGIVSVANERSSHVGRTPTGGGAGIAVALAVAVAVAWGSGVGDRLLWCAPLALGASLLGWWDDRHELRAFPKFAAMVLLALPLTVFVPELRLLDVELPFAGNLSLGFAAVPLCVFWLVGYANAFNFMDGIDGIAGWTSLLAGGAYAVFGALAGDGVTVVLGALLFAASLGFLPWNFPKAQIFMGDAGSLPLGFLVAATALAADHGDALPFPASVLLLGPFLFDVILTLVRRTLRGASLGEAHREHLYQRLSRQWGGHPRVTLLYAGFSTATAGAAFLYLAGGPTGQLLSLTVPLVWMLGFAAVVLRRDRRPAEPDRESP